METKGYDKSEVRVDVPLTVQFKGEDYHSAIDLVVCCKDLPIMAVTCVAGSIGSYEREILAGARLVYEQIIPFAVTTDGRDAIIMDTATGETVGKGLSAVLSRSRSQDLLSGIEPAQLNPAKREGEMIIYRSFNLEKVNK